MTSVKRRFIAGAVCPRCAVMDRIVMFQEEGDQYRECVSCGFREKLVTDDAPREPETRISRAPKADPAVQPIRFFPNPGKARKPE